MAGLYIHIPFCHSKCAYCDFYSMPRMEKASEFVDALEREYRARRNEIVEPSTVYLGGGTPSALPTDLLERIFSIIPLENAKEITMEVNPEDITERFADWIAQSPVNRVSMGVQSLNDEELTAIGRRHSASDAIRAAEMLRSAGISNLSLDLIFGLPGQTVGSWQDTLAGVIALNPQHLSAYALMLEPGTRLWAKQKAGTLSVPSEQEVATMYAHLCSITANNGFEHYEISNFAKKGFRSVHNSSYWDLTPYLGLGPGAHSFDGTTRRYNPGSLRDYLNKPEHHTRIEEENAEERINDYIMIRLRTSEGLSLNSLQQLSDTVTVSEVMRNAERHLRCGHLILTQENTLTIPEPHILISDTIIADLMLV